MLPSPLVSRFLQPSPQPLTRVESLDHPYDLLDCYLLLAVIKLPSRFPDRDVEVLFRAAFSCNQHVGCPNYCNRFCRSGSCNWIRLLIWDLNSWGNTLSIEGRPPYVERGQNVRMCEKEQGHKSFTRLANPDSSSELLEGLKRATSSKWDTDLVELP